MKKSQRNSREVFSSSSRRLVPAAARVAGRLQQALRVQLVKEMKDDDL